MLTTFKEKETALNLALTRVQNRLKYYAENSSQIFEDWNNWHDLEDRIKERLWQNWSNYKDWHFQTFQFNTYP
jgi:hypothetical protein